MAIDPMDSWAMKLRDEVDAKDNEIARLKAELDKLKTDKANVIVEAKVQAHDRSCYRSMIHMVLSALSLKAMPGFESQQIIDEINALRAQLAEARRPVSSDEEDKAIDAILSVHGIERECLRGDEVETMRSILRGIAGRPLEQSPISESDLKRVATNIWQQWPEDGRIKLEDAWFFLEDELLTIAGRPLAVEPVDEEALREAIEEGFFDAHATTGGKPTREDKNQSIRDRLRPLLSRPIAPPESEIDRLVKAMFDDESKHPGAKLIITKFMETHCAEPMTPNCPRCNSIGTGYPDESCYHCGEPSKPEGGES